MYAIVVNYNGMLTCLILSVLPLPPPRGIANHSLMISISHLKPLLIGALFAVPAYAEDRPSSLPLTPGPFAPSWQSLSQYQFPDWFRDAKFGLWAHWGPGNQPEMGDWYGRNLYIQGHRQNKHHVDNYGHPSNFGFKDICNEWKAEKFDPEAMMAIYKDAGAQYFVALANFHDNFDMWNSKHQPWNAVNVGPKRDIIGLWAKAAKQAGLRFGVSMHASSAWSWYEVSQLSDPEGPRKGVRYDGHLTKADGVGKWWEGLDPQELYAQYGHKISPNVLNRKEAWLNPGDSPSKAYLDKYYNRVRDVVSSYQPDLVYFDDARLPLDWADITYGLHILADIYNQSVARNAGKNDAVVNTKKLNKEQRKALVFDFETGVPRDILPEPWQVDVSLGVWHYQKGDKYKKADRVVRALADVVSKNGNMLLVVPLRADGTMDDQGQEILKDVGVWLRQNGEAIYGTRPWKRYGEGPSTLEEVPDIPKGGIPVFRKAMYTAEDIRFTTKGGVLYAVVLNWPSNGSVKISSLGINEPGEITKVQMLGAAGDLRYSRTAEGLEVEMPGQPPGNFAYVLKIEGLGRGSQ